MIQLREGHDMNTTKPLPPSIATALRDGVTVMGRFAELMELAGALYQNGKAGRPHDLEPVPGFDPQLVEMMNRFLLACWEQGRKDAGGLQGEIP